MRQDAPRLGISTASYFNRMPIEDVVSDVGARGVPLVELFLNTYSEYEEPFTLLLRDRLLEAGVTAYSVHPMSMQFEPQLFSIHSRQKADAQAIFRRVLSAARLFGATHYVMHGAAHLSGAAKNLAFDRLVPVFSELCDIAADYGVTLTLENVSWCLFSAPAFGARLVEALGDKLRYTLDVKQAVRSGHDPLEYLDAVGPLVENVHLCDYIQTADGFRWALPLAGEYDFAKLFGALAARGYAGPAFLEVYSDTYGDLSELYGCLDRLRGFPLFQERPQPVAVG